MIRAFVAAPTAALRVGLHSRLDGDDITVVGTGPALEGAPADVDVVIVTDPGPLLVGADALAEIGARAVVAVTDDDRAARILRELPLRGWAVVPRDASRADLRAATAAAARGFTVLPAAVATRLGPRGAPRRPRRARSRVSPSRRASGRSSSSWLTAFPIGGSRPRSRSASTPPSFTWPRCAGSSGPRAERRR